MMQSLAAAVSGLDAEETAMNLVANNIANANTTAYKDSEASFATMLSQTLSGGSAPTTTMGGTNPVQIGLGTQIGAVTTNMAEGAPTETGNPMDVAINGNGFLVVRSASGTAYSRDGALSMDAQGNLVQADSGAQVEGWQPAGGSTTTLTWTAGSAPGAPTPINIPQTVTGTGGTTLSLSSLTISPNGVIIGTYQDANGNSEQAAVGQIAEATFSNPEGLVAAGGNAYIAGADSGTPNYVQPGSSGGGSFLVGALEQSNVDIGTELTNMIVAERSYQVDAKVITTADSMLQSLIQVQ